MAKKNNINSINIAMLSILLLFVATANINSMLAILFIFSIAPMIMLSMGADLKFSTFALILVCAVSYLLYGAKDSLFISFVYLIPAYFSGLLFISDEYVDENGVKYKIKVRKNGNEYRFISIKAFLISLVFFALGNILYFISVKFILNIDLIKEFHAMLNETVTNITQIYKNNLKPSEYQQLVSSGVFDLLKDSSTIILILCFLKSLILSAISYFVCIKLFSCFYRIKTMCVPFDSIFLPGKPVIVLFASVIIMFFIDYSYPDLGVYTMINGYIIVMNMLFFIEGLSIIVFVIKSWKKMQHKINVFVFIFLIVFLGIIPGISVLGMLDNSLDFRKRWYLIKKD